MTAKAPVTGPALVKELIVDKFPDGSRLVIERISDGVKSGGFTWHREADDRPGAVGLRGTLYAELDDSGKIKYVREGCEPIVKPGQATEALLKAATSNMERPEKPPYVYAADANHCLRHRQLPMDRGISERRRAYRRSAPFADDIRYEDFNYPKPFLGKDQVLEFVTAFDIPGLEFVPLKVSEGERAVAFTWKVVVNGEDGAIWHLILRGR